MADRPATRTAPGTAHAHEPRTVPRVTDAAYERASRIFRAAGDPQRLRLLRWLADGEWCVTELAETSGAGLSTVSQRLRLLRVEGLVSTRRQGRHIYYRVADRHVAELLESALAHAVEPDGHDQ